MDVDLSRRTQRLMYEAELLATHAQSLDGVLQQACETGALLVVEQSLTALVAELAAPQSLMSAQWQAMLKELPDTLQERRLLERALLTTDGELYGLHLRLEQQRTGRLPVATGVIVTTALATERVAQLKALVTALRTLANALRESSRFC